MTTFLAIMLTFVITLVISFFGTTWFHIWLIARYENYRNYWQKVIYDFSDEDDWD